MEKRTIKSKGLPTWNDCDGLERPEDPEGSEGGQVAEVDTHCQVPEIII